MSMDIDKRLRLDEDESYSHVYLLRCIDHSKDNRITLFFLKIHVFQNEAGLLLIFFPKSRLNCSYLVLEFDNFSYEKTIKNKTR